MENLELLILCLVAPVIKVVHYLSTYVTFDQDKVVITSGIFTKKKVEIPIGTITTVDLTQPVVYQLFHVYKVTIDNGSQSPDVDNAAEIALSLREDQAVKVKEMVGRMTRKDKEEIEDETKLTGEPILAAGKELLLLGVYRGHIVPFFSFLLGLSTMFTMVQNNEEMSGQVKTFVDWYFTILNPVGGTVLLFLVSYAAAVLLPCVMNYIRYYGFLLSRKSDTVQIEFGLLTKKKYSLNKKKISGIVVKQSLLMRWFGYAEVEVLIIGFGDSSAEDKKEKAMLYPMMKLEEIPAFLERILPGYPLELELEQARRGTLRYFFLCPRVVVCLALAATASVYFLNVSKKPTVFTAMLVLLLLAVGMLCSAYQEYHNSGIRIKEQGVAFSNGGFTKTYYFISREKLEYASFGGSRWKQRKKLGNIEVGFQAPVTSNVIRVRNMTEEQFEQLQALELV